VSLFFRHQKYLEEIDEGKKVLELGSGVCNNYPFFKSVGYDYYGVEFSSSAVAKALNRFPELEGKIKLGDFTQLDFEDNYFDIICDRASVTHCNSSQIDEVVSESKRTLKKKGLYFGIDWFSKKHSDFNLVADIVDKNTKSNFNTGQFAGLGQVHFASADNIKSYFQDFEILYLAEKRIQQYQDFEEKYLFASFNHVARRSV
jgi:ubiquinone/menaquinone biosynthesis C-methylase UbiE